MPNRFIKIYPPLYMLMGAGLIWCLHLNLPIYTLPSPLWQQMAYVFIGLALILDLSSLGLFLWQSTTAHPFREHNTSQLVITGFYRISRNPMYLGLLLLQIGWACYLGSLSGFIIPPLFIWVITTQQIIHEEHILTEKFGEVYIAYQQQVRRWL